MASSFSSVGLRRADSYIGCPLILISISDIRYEGTISRIDLRTSTILLDNVRSFGTEGRKKNGPQIPPTKEIYGKVLFHGDEIKALKIFLSPPSMPKVYGDPLAPAQSHHTSTTGKERADSFSNETQPISTRAFACDASATCQRMVVDFLSVSEHSFTVPNPAHHRASTATQFQEQHYQSASAVQTPQIPINQCPGPSVINNSVLEQDKFHRPRSTASSPEIRPRSTASSPEIRPRSSASSPDIQPRSSASSPEIRPRSTASSPESHPGSTARSPEIQPKSTASSPEQAVYYERTDSTPLLPLPPKFHPSNASFSEAPLLPRPVSWQQQQLESQFDEEFDFVAMNEKFKKEEIWGSLGRPKYSGEGHGMPEDNEKYIYDRKNVYNVYNRDEFFDTLSCDSLDQRGWNRWTRMRHDNSETFGDLQSYGRGNVGASGRNYRGGYHNQGRGFGFYRGRGYRDRPQPQSRSSTYQSDAPSFFDKFGNDGS